MADDLFDEPALTCVQLYREDSKLTACACEEPSLTLVRNDSQFGLLIATSAFEDSVTSCVFLEEVTYLSIAGQRWHYADFDTVAISRQEAVWVAQDTTSGRYFPTPSRRPYHVIFISDDEYEQIVHTRDDELAFPVFAFAQRRFGLLPGFSYHDNCLRTPRDYANESNFFENDDYVCSIEV